MSDLWDILQVMFLLAVSGAIGGGTLALVMVRALDKRMDKWTEELRQHGEDI
jgi:hypothetical protein